jgi:hypothetical protein
MVGTLLVTKSPDEAGYVACGWEKKTGCGIEPAGGSNLGSLDLILPDKG